MRTAKTLDQSGWMPRLIRVFAGRTSHFACLSCCGSNEASPQPATVAVMFGGQMFIASSIVRMRGEISSSSYVSLACSCTVTIFHHSILAATKGLQEKNTQHMQATFGLSNVNTTGLEPSVEPFGHVGAALERKNVVCNIAALHVKVFILAILCS